MVEEKKKETKIIGNDPWNILLYPLLTEKAIGKIETENQIIKNYKDEIKKIIF